MAGKGTIIVTGANGGLGSAIAEHIASRPELLGHHGIYIVRDASTAPALAAALSRGSPSHKQEVVSLDLTNLANVRQVAQHINVSPHPNASQGPHVLPLSNAAGCSIEPRVCRPDPAHPRPHPQRWRARLWQADVDE